jgi:hypothetical protein
MINVSFHRNILPQAGLSIVSVCRGSRIIMYNEKEFAAKLLLKPDFAYRPAVKNIKAGYL